ncbi:dethiobiotin synthase [Vreelandella boliviensis]|uniref:ATP-dependent dethiobiotin synthetase BioD n=1 Tax=Vreelandella boliviensis LC1 TaxID=1072583 RepID=A0A265E3J0_9GAMM|nr:dethiobiotin synthase [Halomonas boliviensis]EHJ93685.1 Dethiobiotin synthetase [Halomonas boliviensis LC1]OZT75808.1 dethiobiotin synthase [Halomonas boliviensis LC1]
MNFWFVTGTDTDAGKTLVTSGLLHAAQQQPLSTLGLKPIASGSQATPDGLRNSDALALQAQTVPSVDYTTVNPIAFAPAIAPHLASLEAGQSLEVGAITDILRETLSQTPRDFTLIEGAGGWRVPLNDHEDFADLAIALELPVILVVGLKLGCLNHARLTAEAIRADGLVLAGWAGSVVDPDFAADTARFEANIAHLNTKLAAPCLGIIPHLDTPSAATAAPYLSLEPL